MKFLFVLLIFISTTLFSSAQREDSNVPGVIKKVTACKSCYVYQPPQKLLIPKNVKAEILYNRCGVMNTKFISLNKVDNAYQFLFQAPDSVSVLIIGIVDADKVDDQNGLLQPKMEVVDNNNKAGFIIHFNNANGRQNANDNVNFASLLIREAHYKLDIRPVNSYIIKLYEDAYKLDTNLITQNSYLDYLSILFEEKRNAVKSKLLAYAAQLSREGNDEKKWIKAVSVFKIMDMYDEAKLLESNILSAFPNGDIAKEKYWHDFYDKKENSENAILESMNAYVSRFNDSSNNIKDRFYDKILSFFFDKKDWISFLKYQQLYNRKSFLELSNDGFAKILSGRKMSDPGSDLEIAKLLSGKSLLFVEGEFRKANPYDISYLSWEQEYYRNISTYALILFKSRQYDSAFYYQDLLYKNGAVLNAEQIERYAVYSQKVKGNQYAKGILEEHLLKGINSPSMLAMLQVIYKELNLPEDAFDQLQRKNIDIYTKQNNGIINKKFGTSRAKDFVLKNMAGEKISLSSFKNKVVVLDFWATWCGPCRASFPFMQNLVTKYKDDTTVAFLFIDVWERTTPDKTSVEVQKIMKDNNYTFNVLFDTKNNIAKNYQVHSIPAKFVINKHGDIVYTGDMAVDISWVIEHARNN